MGTKRFVDLSISIEPELPSDPPMMIPKIDYINHEMGAEQMKEFYPGLKKEQLPGSLGWAVEFLTLTSHSGTHLDAPLHFSERGLPVDGIAVERLVAPAVVIDVAERAARVPEYALRSEDVLDFEARHGRIAPGSVALLRTGWDRFWPDRERYLGDATPGDASKLRFPSLGVEAARLLAARGVAGVGVDTASIDVGSSRDFPVHRVLAAGDVYGLENLRGLDALPPTGATLIALPMKIAAGSGAPVRAIALLPEPRP